MIPFEKKVCDETKENADAEKSIWIRENNIKDKKQRRAD